ncbi:hypothetical protein [Polynucleobacter necessarius]|nr:hypothetical protein [Polynucleobacter necessarius]
MVDPHTSLQDEAEAAFFPSVTGG